MIMSRAGQIEAAIKDVEGATGGGGECGRAICTGARDDEDVDELTEDVEEKDVEVGIFVPVPLATGSDVKGVTANRERDVGVNREPVLPLLLLFVVLDEGLNTDPTFGVKYGARKELEPEEIVADPAAVVEGGRK